MAYNVSFKKSVARDLKRLGSRDAERVLDKIDSDLSRDPERFPALTGRFAGLRKCRVGDFRVAFVITGDDVLILRIQHRKDVYRKGK